MTDDELHAIAGEYVIGTLPDGEHIAFSARLTGDRRARAAVEAWRVRLEPLLATAPERVPPAAAWQGIATRIGSRAGNDNDRRVSPAWRGLAVAASVLALLAGTLAVRPVAPVVAPPVPAVAGGADYVSAVMPVGVQPALLVTIDARSGKAMVRAIGLTPPNRKSLELWYIGDGRDPKSMGLVTGDMQAEMALADMIARGDRLDASQFAVTVEPMGGAPGGVPTGSILYSGKVMPVSGT